MEAHRDKKQMPRGLRGGGSTHLDTTDDAEDRPLIDAGDIAELAPLENGPGLKRWYEMNGIDELAGMRAGRHCLTKPDKQAAALAAFRLGHEVHRRATQRRAERRAGPRYVVQHVIVDRDAEVIIGRPIADLEYATEEATSLNCLGADESAGEP